MIVFSTQTFPPSIGGMETVTAALARHWTAAGQAVTVFADSRRRHASAESDFDKSYPCPVQRFGGMRPLRRWKKFRAIARFCSGNAIRAIYTDSWKSIPASPLPAPILCLAHGNDLLSTAKRQRRRRAFSRAAVIIANSHFTADLTRRDAPDPERIRVIHPGVDPLPEPSDATRRAVSQLIAGRTPVLATIARLEPRKGIDMVIRALPALRRQHPEIIYLVIGGGDDRRRLQKLARECDVSDRVHFLGPSSPEKRSAVLQAADLFVMPSRRVDHSVEGFGIVFLEAAAAGTPSVAGADGGAGDATAETGWLCDGSDAGRVAETVAAALSDRDELARRGGAAKQRAETLFDWQRIAACHLDLIDEAQRL